MGRERGLHASAVSLSSSYSGISFLKYHFKFQIKSSGSSNCSSLRHQSWGHIQPRWWGLTTTTRTALDSVCDTLVRGYSDYASQYVVHWKGLVKTARARWTSFDKLSAPFMSVSNTCHRYLFQYQFDICIVGINQFIIIYLLLFILYLLYYAHLCSSSSFTICDDSFLSEYYDMYVRMLSIWLRYSAIVCRYIGLFKKVKKEFYRYICYANLIAYFSSLSSLGF